MFNIDKAGVNGLNAHMIAIGQRIVKGDLVVVVVLVRLVRLFYLIKYFFNPFLLNLFSTSRANFRRFRHFATLLAIQK